MKERTLNFSEREGLKPLPDAYQLEELSYEVRNELKYIFEEILNKFFRSSRGENAVPDWHKIFKDFHIRFLELPVEAFYAISCGELSPTEGNCLVRSSLQN